MLANTDAVKSRINTDRTNRSTPQSAPWICAWDRSLKFLSCGTDLTFRLRNMKPSVVVVDLSLCLGDVFVSQFASTAPLHMYCCCSDCENINQNTSVGKKLLVLVSQV